MQLGQQAVFTISCPDCTWQLITDYSLENAKSHVISDKFRATLVEPMTASLSNKGISWSPCIVQLTETLKYKHPAPFST